MLTLLPKCVKLITDADITDPNLMSPITDTAEPNRAKLLMDMDVPTFTKSKMLVAAPSLANVRIDKELPQ
jgi:hypothetical protein